MQRNYFKLLIFDKDGTLFDFAQSWNTWAKSALLALADGDETLFRALADRLSFDPDRGVFLPDSVAIAGTLDETAQHLAPLFAANCTPQQIAARLNYLAQSAVMVEATPLAPLLKGLQHEGYTLAVATNGQKDEAEAHLAAHAIRPYFAEVIGCDSGYGAKPNPAMCAHIARACDIPPARVVMVGDSLHDLLAGRAAGMATVGVLTGIADHGTLAPHADAVLPDIGHLPAWLGH
ncbi:MAG: HAD family hydrolase [Proteobacteria bacterium]|nr:HAD family hydrolase [Pseudomonadota bacterium]NBX42676.1 HAD family hydrolase [Paracoccaceae bacterium]